MPGNKKKQQRLFLPKENSNHDPLEIYLKEIRKTQLLTHQEETYWATIVWNEKSSKIKLLKKAVRILRSLEHQNPLNRLMVLNKKSIYGYINLKTLSCFIKNSSKQKTSSQKLPLQKKKTGLPKIKSNLNQPLQAFF